MPDHSALAKKHGLSVDSGKMEPPPPKPAELPAFSDVPAFIRSEVDPKTITQKVMPPRTDDLPGTETVSQAFPGRIEVYHPDKYNAGTQTHEMTHEFQNTKSDGGVRVGKGYSIYPFSKHAPEAQERYQLGSTKNYDYGGEKGLLEARKQGKGIGDFNHEQQADMVETYQKKYNGYMAKAKAGTLTEADKKAMYQSYEAYHPYIQQMANVPKKFKDTLPKISALFGSKVPLGPSPSAPGLPDYSVAGLNVIPADPLMGGKSVDTSKGGVNPYMAVRNPRGLVEPGNLPIWNRPSVKNDDGSHSTEFSRSFGDDKGREVLVPTVVNGKFLTPDGKKPKKGSPEEKKMFKAAWQHYLDTGENLGKFKSVRDADAYADALHNRGEGK